MVVFVGGGGGGRAEVLLACCCWAAAVGGWGERLSKEERKEGKGRRSKEEGDVRQVAGCLRRESREVVRWLEDEERVGWLLGGLVCFPQSQRASTSLNHHPVVQSPVKTRVCCCHKPKI
jgi:hypothetical protein